MLEDITPPDSVVPVLLDPTPLAPVEGDLFDFDAVNATPTTNLAIVRSPNGTLWRLTATNAGTVKSVQLTPEEVAAFEAGT